MSNDAAAPTIRAATPSDARGIGAVQVATWHATYRGIIADDFIDRLTVDDRERAWAHRLERPIPDTGAALSIDRPLIFVAEGSARILGFVCGGAIRDPEPGYDGELYALYVLPEAQRRGTGQALVRTLAAALSARGFRAMTVQVLARNPARLFYERCGARYLGEHDHEFGGARYPEARYGWPDLAAVLPG